MKITRIEQFFPRKRTRLVKVSTDEGLVGWGETTLEGRPKSTCAAVPNFLAQEQVDACLGNGLLQEDWVVKDGYVDLPAKPGPGFDIDEDAAQRTIDYTEELGGEFFHPTDGSVADW